MVTLCTLIQTVPVSFNGWGVRESVFILYFHQVGLPRESALAFSLVGAGLIVAPEAADQVSEILEIAGLRSGALSDLEGALYAMVLFALGLFYLSTAILLLRTRRAGWTLTMLITGLPLALQIWSWWLSGTIPTVSLLINVVAVFYLKQRVREAFGVAGGRIGSALEERG